MSYFPSSHLALSSMTHSLRLFSNLPPGDSFPCSQMTLPSIPHYLWLFPNLPPGGFFLLLTDGTHSLWLFPNLPSGDSFPLFTDDTTIYTAFSLTFPTSAAGAILSLTHRWHYRLYHILPDFFLLCPQRGKFHSSQLIPREIYSTSSTLATLTPQREISSLNVAYEGIFSLHKGGKTDLFKLGAGGEGVKWPGKWRR